MKPIEIVWSSGEGGWGIVMVGWRDSDTNLVTLLAYTEMPQWIPSVQLIYVSKNAKNY
jgi:hypothetical protein